MEASETTTATEPAPEQTTEEQPSSDVTEQIAALTERVDAIAPTPQEPQPVRDLGAALSPQQTEEEPEFDPSLYETEAEPFANAEELDAYLNDRDERIQSLETQLADREVRERDTALNALAEKYDELRDETWVNRIRDELLPLAQQRNDPDLLLDPRLIELTHKSLKADAESAKEVPAEEAANQGASLETGAGPGNQVEDASYSDQKGDAIVNAGARQSAFT